MSIVVHPIVYIQGISQLIRFARVSSQVSDFNNRNKTLTVKPLKQEGHYRISLCGRASLSHL